MDPARQAALVEITNAFTLMQGAAAGFLSRVEAELKLSGPHLAALESVNAGATKVGDVATMSRTHVSSASRTVDALVEQGLLLRDPDPSDRRAVILSLTPAGRERMERFAELQVELIDGALRDVATDRLAPFADLMTTFGHGVVQTIQDWVAQG